MKWDAPVLCTKQAICYWFVTFNRWLLEGGLLHLQLVALSDSQNCKKKKKKKLPKNPLIYCHHLIPISTLYPLYCVRAISIYTPYFKYPHRKKYGTLMSGRLTGHGIPYTWRCSSFLINTHTYFTDTFSLNRIWNGKISPLFRCSDYAPTPPSHLVRKKFVLNCVSRLCTILCFGDYCCIQF